MTNVAQFTDAEVDAVRTLKSLIDLSAEELEEKNRTAAALIQELAALHDFVGFVVNPQQYHVSLLFSQTKRAIFRVTKEGDIALSNADRVAIPLAIEFDRISREWIGTEIDPNVVPIPGQRYPRKAPLLVLAEAVVKAINFAGPTMSSHPSSPIRST